MYMPADAGLRNGTVAPLSVYSVVSPPAQAPVTASKVPDLWSHRFLTNRPAGRPQGNESVCVLNQRKGNIVLESQGETERPLPVELKTGKCERGVYLCTCCDTCICQQRKKRENQMPRCFHSSDVAAAARF